MAVESRCRDQGTGTAQQLSATSRPRPLYFKMRCPHSLRTHRRKTAATLNEKVSTESLKRPFLGKSRASVSVSHLRVSAEIRLRASVVFYSPTTEVMWSICILISCGGPYFNMFGGFNKMLSKWQTEPCRGTPPHTPHPLFYTALQRSSVVVIIWRYFAESEFIIYVWTSPRCNAILYIFTVLPPDSCGICIELVTCVIYWIIIFFKLCLWYMNDDLCTAFFSTVSNIRKSMSSTVRVVLQYIVVHKCQLTPSCYPNRIFREWFIFTYLKCMRDSSYESNSPSTWTCIRLWEKKMR